LESKGKRAACGIDGWVEKRVVVHSTVNIVIVMPPRMPRIHVEGAN
jgi:hypothetical protein